MIEPTCEKNSNPVTDNSQRRRDIGNLLFHFTKKNSKKGWSAYDVLKEILTSSKLLGSPIKNNVKCICFSEAPIQEWASIFSLTSVPYESFGIAVRKDWLYERGGRPVIYNDPNAVNKLAEELKYLHVDYDPLKKIDTTWEREWRINAEELILDSLTLVIVPTAKIAFDIAYLYSEEKKTTAAIERIPQGTTYAIEGGLMKPQAPNEDNGESQVTTLTREAKWMTVSLDLFDVNLSKS